LPSLKEFEEIRRMAFSDSETPAPEPAEPVGEAAAEVVAEPPADEPAAEAPAVEVVAESRESVPVAPAAEPASNEEN
jgi:hypothetical protein